MDSLAFHRHPLPYPYYYKPRNITPLTSKLAFCAIPNTNTTTPDSRFTLTLTSSPLLITIPQISTSSATIPKYSSRSASSTYPSSSAASSVNASSFVQVVSPHVWLHHSRFANCDFITGSDDGSINSTSYQQLKYKTNTKTKTKSNNYSYSNNNNPGQQLQLQQQQQRHHHHHHHHHHYLAVCSLHPSSSSHHPSSHHHPKFSRFNYQLFTHPSYEKFVQFGEHAIRAELENQGKAFVLFSQAAAFTAPPQASSPTATDQTTITSSAKRSQPITIPSTRATATASHSQPIAIPSPSPTHDHYINYSPLTSLSLSFPSTSSPTDPSSSILTNPQDIDDLDLLNEIQHIDNNISNQLQQEEQHHLYTEDEDDDDDDDDDQLAEEEYVDSSESESGPLKMVQLDCALVEPDFSDVAYENIVADALMNSYNMKTSSSHFQNHLPHSTSPLSSFFDTQPVSIHHHHNNNNNHDHDDDDQQTYYQCAFLRNVSYYLKFDDSNKRMVMGELDVVVYDPIEQHVVSVVEAKRVLGKNKRKAQVKAKKQIYRFFGFIRLLKKFPKLHYHFEMNGRPIDIGNPRKWDLKKMNAQIFRGKYTDSVLPDYVFNTFLNQNI